MRTGINRTFLTLAALLPAFLLSSCHHKCETCGTVKSCSGYSSTDFEVIPAMVTEQTPSSTVPPPPAWLGEPKPNEVKPAEVKPVEVKPVEVKPVEVKPVEVKPVEVKPAEVKPVEIKKPEVKPVEPAVVKPVTPAERKIVRIRAGSVSEWKDKSGNVWMPDSGFVEGAMVDRGKITIEKTEDGELYSTEHCCMDKFVWPVANGKYTVKLHFAETFEDVKKAGERVFSFDVLGEKVKDFDIFKAAGGANKALVMTFHVNVTGNKVEIVFTKSDLKEPAINGIEILPE